MARADRNSPYRDYYVWSDDDQRYASARLIFPDVEISNWTYDPVAGQYFWHRFFRHQPDLNFDNPAVRQEMMNIVRYWLGMGLDGFRCDAAPHLFEREHTACEGLPETHAFFKDLRAMIDREFPGKILLAEANQWPAELLEYFAAGDEFQMAFHFPLMPRLFMALKKEDRLPIVEILQQTPAIPDTCQWAVFLRNHDEMTLEMVTSEERDYLYAEYARDPRMRINAGIRRRLAPLLDNGLDEIELLYSLLFTLIGSPVIYYGDEFGMGDNIYLGDRNGVRTPMHWNGDRNAGFSTADPDALFAPVIQNPVYHYQAINVEGQLRTPTSLLWRVRRLIATRQRHPVFGRGTFEMLYPLNRAVIAYLREWNNETVLVVHNLSRRVQPVELDLSRWEGRVPVELFGGSRFPRIETACYFLSLGPHDYFWFRLEAPERNPQVAVPLPGR